MPGPDGGAGWPRRAGPRRGGPLLSCKLIRKYSEQINFYTHKIKKDFCRSLSSNTFLEFLDIYPKDDLANLRGHGDDVDYMGPYFDTMADEC